MFESNAGNTSATTPKLFGEFESTAEPMALPQTEEEFLATCATLDAGSLPVEMQRVPAQYAYVAELLANATHEKDKAELVLELTEASLNETIRQRLETDPSRPKVTVDIVKARVLLSEEYRIAASAVVEAKAKVARLRGAVDAVHMKAQMLTNLGLRHNAELRLATPVAR